MGEVEQPHLMKRGAEASLYLAGWHGFRVIIKKRKPKAYRHPKLDEQIRTYRTMHEPQLMHEAKIAGVSTPTVFLVDRKEAAIIMEYIEGEQVKNLLSEISKTERHDLCFTVGELIGKLHVYGIIHGDLTTSNMIRNLNNRIFFLDFGLGEKRRELEAMGVDLHLMKRALVSTHFRFAGDCFKAVLRGYRKVVDEKTARNVFKKIEEIERRGRYVSGRKRVKSDQD
jgi:TP53 regulating kinase-like protein